MSVVNIVSANEEQPTDNLTEVMLRPQFIDTDGSVSGNVGSISEKLKNQSEVEVRIVFKDIRNATLRDQIFSEALSNLSGDFRGSSVLTGGIYELHGFITAQGLEKLRTNPFIWSVHEPITGKTMLEDSTAIINATKNISGITTLLNKTFVELDADKKIGDGKSKGKEELFQFFIIIFLAVIVTVIFLFFLIRRIRGKG
ncbi:hypothetical protein HY643_04560 [Candidatus Woesearchaeota archaeon]|nr:hypothetical protein [Candidatus Woesearchaeota archaeon]